MLATDYGNLGEAIALVFGAITLIGCLLGVATSATLVSFFRRKWIWYATPFFIVIWSAFACGVYMLLWE